MIKSALLTLLFIKVYTVYIRRETKDNNRRESFQ